MSEQRIDDLSLSECHSYDPRPGRSGGRLRFRCPRHGGDRQQSLSVDPESGHFRCFSCGAWGTLLEHRQDRDRFPWQKPVRVAPPVRKAEPLPPNDRAVRRAREGCELFPGSPAHDYARYRGIPDELAFSLGLGYWPGRWQEEESEWLTFGLFCPLTGRPVAVYGRNLHSDERDRKGRVLGPRGLFGAPWRGSLPEDVLLVEGPFDAIACLLNPFLPPALAAIGDSARPEWFDGCRRVSIAFDDDPAGQEGARRLVGEIIDRRRRRGAGPQVFSLQPGSLQRGYGVKDFGELMARGVDVILDLPPLGGETTQRQGAA